MPWPAAGGQQLHRAAASTAESCRACSSSRGGPRAGGLLGVQIIEAAASSGPAGGRAMWRYRARRRPLRLAANGTVGRYGGRSPGGMLTVRVQGIACGGIRHHRRQRCGPSALRGVRCGVVGTEREVGVARDPSVSTTKRQRRSVASAAAALQAVRQTRSATITRIAQPHARGHCCARD